MQRWFVSLDTDKVKEYVFATGRLKEIRGASSLLDYLNRQKTVEIAKNHQGDVIFAGGGSAIVEFADTQVASEFCSEMSAIYLNETGTCSITSVIEEYDDEVKDRNNPNSFHSKLQWAAIHLQKKKLGAGHVPSTLLSQPLWMRCQRCGIYPATEVDQDPEGIIHICSICKAKREAGKNSVYSAFSSPIARFQDHAEDFPKNLRFPNELKDLGNYIGLIYADGNGIGNFIRDSINTPDEMRSFSKILENSILDALQEATRPFWTLKSPTVPFLPIILGGDDVLLITSGKIAMRIASQLCIQFQECMLKRSGDAIKDSPNLFGGKPIQAGMSAGIMIAKSNYPLYALEPLSVELLHSAKQLSNQLKQAHGIQPVIDFRVVSSPSANSLSVIRDTEYLIKQKTWATCRPYPCNHIEGEKRPAWSEIEEVVAQLRKENFPRNKLHQWQNLLFISSPLQAELELSRIRAHLDPKRRTAMDKIITDKLHFSTALDLFIQDIPEKGELSSPLPDIEEIFEFC
ncbi:MAG: hypothetical protein AB9888_15360 [Bacteroidales bacterium]